MRYFQSLFVVALVALSSTALAQSELSPPEPQLVSDGAGLEAEPAQMVSEPDYRVLRRMKTFRGPYSDQDDPQLLKRLAKEAERKGVDTATTACRPPACAREPNTLIIKVATPGQEQKMLAKMGAGAQYSDLFDEQLMTPVFSPQLVANVVKTYNTVMAAQQGTSANLMPKNSLGNRVDLDRWRTLAVPKGVDLDAAIEELSLDPRVEVVEPNYEMRLFGEESKPASGSPVQTSNIVADDPQKADQWALTRTRTEEAWQWLDDNGYPAWGDRNIVVAVIDSGVDYNHEDLAGNMWVNAGEIPDNGIDDDNNGFVDDVYGADVVGSTFDHDGDPQDDNGHGTHVAGIIAAQGNNGLGIIGVAPNTQIMAIKAAQYSGALTSTDISEGILYAYQQGADIINMSFGGSGRSILTEEALAIAFSNAVLIAAAGNYASYNEANCGLFSLAIYPGAYPYVLGVMAEAQAPQLNGDWLAGFSNWDCVGKNSVEYEVMAPGVDVLSTIPGNGYAAWDGTSMAAPVVSGMAALARTRFDDKSVYSSRFIMGQLASTGVVKQGKTPPSPCLDCNPRLYSSADAIGALTSVPNPSVSYLEHYLWDSEDLSVNNDDDGVVDAGETIDLGVVLKNYWGQGKNVTVTISAQADGAVGPDPYVTFEVASVNYGSVGSFAEDDNGFVTDDSGLVTGVTNPFRFTVSASTPNQHIIPLKVTVTAENGLDPSDTETYSTDSRFYLTVQRGRSLPSIIAGDDVGTPGGNIDTDGVVDGVVTLDDSNLWLIDQPTLIASGAELRITSGAIVQWSPETSAKAYGEVRSPYLQVEGQLTVVGSADSPVVFQPSPLYPRWAVLIFNPTGDITRLNYSYAKVHNLWMMQSLDRGWSNRSIVPTGIFEHTELIRSDRCLQVASLSSPRSECSDILGKIQLSKSIVKWRTDTAYWGLGQYFNGSIFSEVLFNNSDLKISPNIDSQGGGFSTFENSVVLDSRSASDGSGRPGIMVAQGTQVSNNAFLNPVFETDLSKWFRVRTSTQHDGTPIALGSNYWGSSSDAVASLTVFDQADDFNLGLASLDPILDKPAVSTYPMVISVEVLDGNGNPRPDNLFSAEETNWRVKFNRDMDTQSQPFVTYGPDAPYTDFTVIGQWTDPRTWEGAVAISPVATDGYQYIRIAGATAADDKWLDIGVDQKRFRFEVSTSGAESLNLQASGGEGFVDLSWNQDDYDTLLGFNIYRSTSPDSGFIRINQTLVGNGERSYRDTGVDPGVQYYYYFTVALDGSESEPSNTASATPIDTVKPILSHSVISTAPFGSTVLISANVTDNIGVQSVTLYYRAIGGGSYTSVNMANISGSTYRASIPASATQPPGVEYYIAATDGASFAYSGRSTSPNTITVENNPVVTGVTPNTGSSAGGDTITVTGNNFVSGASVLLGNATCQNVTLVDASRLTCVTPASAPELVAVKVINPDGGTGVLTSAFTFVGNSTTLSLPEFQANKGQTRDIALSIDPVSGLQSFSAVISFDNTHLTLGNIVPGPLASGWNFGYSMVDENTVNIQAFSDTRVSGAGKLAILEFLVIAEGDAASVLDIESAQLNEGTIQATLVDGSFSIFPGYTVSGSVKYWDATQKPIEALLTLNDLQEQTSAADTGAYSFAGLLDQQHTIKIEKFDDIDDSIRAYDASLILSHVLGTQTLTGSALASADVTGDGSVSTQDAAKIAEVAAGLATVPFPNQASAWRFEPAERQFNSLTADFAAADFTGLFMGDVSGNWSGTGTASGEGLRLEVADMSRLDSGAIIADINAYAGSMLTPEAISAVELSFNTSSGVSLLSVEQAVATDSWTLPIIRADDERLGFTLYDDVSGAFVGEAHVLTLRLSVADTHQQIERLAGHVNERAVFDSKSVPIRLPDDQDGDLVRDDDDAFPYDAAASVDTDGDGAPDKWNPFATDEEIAASSLVLDLFPKDPDEYLDDDGDGEGNNRDPDDDGDGFTDAEEIAAGTDPNDPTSVPDLGGFNVLFLKAIIEASKAAKE